MKIILKIAAIFILLNCSIKKKYENDSFDKNVPLCNPLQKFNFKENTSTILFLETFNNDSLVIKNSKDQTIKKVLLNPTSESMQLTSIQSVSNKEDIILDFKNSRKIFLKKQELLKYKLIYIAKPAYENNKYRIIFTNNWKRLR